MNDFLIIAQAVTQLQPPQDWTLLGLLAAVLGGVGWFLRSYLPQQLLVFSTTLKEDRETWVGLLEAERSAGEVRLNTVVVTFEKAVDKLDSSIRELKDKG